MIWLTLLLFISIGYGKSPNKIMGGITVTENDFPFMVSIGTPKFGSCSGSIISKDYILTSAHCVVEDKNIIMNEVRVLSGTNDIFNETTGQIHEVDVIIPFRKYNPPKFNHDVAILKLADSIVFSPYQQPIALPDNDFIPVNEIVMTGGWGVTNLNEELPSRYNKKIFLNVSTHEECMKTFPLDIDLSYFCAVKSEGKGGITAGDSGGPLVYKNKIIGIVIAAKDDYFGPTSSVFTKTWLYARWINKVIKND